MSPSFESSGELPSQSGSPGECRGDVIGRYTLLEELGEGGMGTVWLASQTDPVVREVALKIIKAGMDTREVIARFEAERQALALMDHPWIAKVLDGGATASGRPYFVMEHVRGVPMTEACDAARLDTQARLELFVKVCEAIQHAHQKGIIHRDIKPSNVLVTESDGELAPKVIDFGIAKATGGEFPAGTLLTQHAQMLGTPEYMAPEQAAMSGLDIDTRADVYALGMLLYELLTGAKPFDLQRVITSGYQELLRVIREVDPPRPSTRVTRDETGHQVAERRRVDLDTLVKGLSGDLDWIVMKALEKERSRRYASASELAADIVRYLHHEPVTAAPPSTFYRWRKLVQRRRKTVVAVAVIAILFLAGSVGTGVGYVRTLRANAALDDALGEKDAALASEVEQRELANANAQRAQKAEAEARTEADRAMEAEALARARAAELEQVAEFQAAQLKGIDPGLMGDRLRRAVIDAAPAGQRDPLVASLAPINFTNLALDSLEQNLFDRTIRAIDAQFANQPIVRARLLQTMADTLYDLGLYERAVGPQERALALRRAELGDESSLTHISLARTAALLRARGRTDEAEPSVREALELSRRLHGEEHPDTLTWLSDLAGIYSDRGEQAKAEELLREAVAGLRVALGDDHELTLNVLANLGTSLFERGDYAGAESAIRESLAGHRRLFGDDHPATLTSINGLAALLYGQGRFEEAEPYYRECIAGRRRVLGDDHPETVSTIGNLAILLREMGRLADSEPYFREAYERGLRVQGKEHPDTLTAMRNMGGLLRAQGKYTEADALFLETLEISRRLLGDDHPFTLVIINDLGTLRYAEGRQEEAESYMREALEGHRRNLGEDHPDVLTESYNLGVLTRKLGKLSESEALLRSALEGRCRILGLEHQRTQDAINSLRVLYEMLVQSARDESDEPRLGEALTKLGMHELRFGFYATSEELLTEALDVDFRTLPETDPRSWQVLGDLGTAIASQGRYEEAEPLVLESAERLLEIGKGFESLEGMAERAVHPSVPAADSVQRVVEFYEAWEVASPGQGHGEEAASWRARLGARDE